MKPIIFKALILGVSTAIIVLLSIEIADEPKFSGKYLSTCEPNDAGIYETEIYHHVLERCSTYYENIDDINTSKLNYTVNISVNSLGFRNKEYSVTKPPKTTRLILLGDSFTCGLGVESEDTFYTKLENKLNMGCKGRFEVWNLAVTSFGTPVQYLITKNKIINYSPDMVLLMFDLSDFSDTLFYESQGTFADGELISISSNNPNWFEARTNITNSFFENASNESMPVRTFEFINKTFKYILKISEILGRNNISFEVITYPYPDSQDDSESVMCQDLYGQLGKHNVSHFSMFPYMKPGSRSKYYNPNHGHWNEEGSAYVTEIIYGHLKTKEPFTSLCG